MNPVQPRSAEQFVRYAPGTAIRKQELGRNGLGRSLPVAFDTLPQAELTLDYAKYTP